MKAKIALFKGKRVRKIIHNNEWWFVLRDIVELVTDTANPKDYITKMKKRDGELSKGWGQIVTLLWVDTAGGRQKLNCVNTEGGLRIIQAIPSIKAEPLKVWLARTGYERVQEIEDPELGIRRVRATYKAKGYPEDWIERRMRGIAIRDGLTDEWKNRGIEGKGYAILTAEISKATFGVTPAEHKHHKGLQRENLRDHFTDLEQIFSMLGEASTTEIIRNKNIWGLSQNLDAAKTGGRIAGNARKALEDKTGKSVLSGSSYVDHPTKKKISKPI